MIRSILHVQPVSAALAVADLVLMRLWVAGDLSTSATLVHHVAVIVVVGGIALAVWPHERMRTSNSLLLGLLLGPVGGLVVLIVDLGRGNKVSAKAYPARKAAAPPRAEELLHAEILQGRRRRAGGQVLVPFAKVFASGTLQRQQEAIAAISLSYRREMLPALRLALASEVPAVRVQAAAVYAKLRGSFDERAKAVRAAAAQGPLAPSIAAEAETVAASGFVDRDSAIELRALASRAATAARPAPPRRRKDAPVRPSQLKRYARGGVA